jgi:cell division protease FtsH
MIDQPMPEGQSGVIKKRKLRYWIWFLGFVVLILVISWFNRQGPIIEIQQSRFNNMVEQRAIKKIVLVRNEMIVEATLKPQSLQNAVYKMELEQINSPFGVEPNGPHYMMTIASVDKFYRDYEAITGSFPREDIIDIQVEDRNDVTGMLINWLFLGLLIFGIVALARAFSRR